MENVNLPRGTDPPREPAGPPWPLADARKASIEEIEVDLLLEGIFRAHGVDLRRASRSTPVRAAIRRIVRAHGLRSVTALLEEILHEVRGVDRLAALLGQVDLFSDPDFLGAFRDQVIPWLRTYPYSAIWAAESGTGAEVYALAILLEEAGVYDRVRIYATQRDAARVALLDAGLTSPLAVELGEAGYRDAGGRARLADYFEPRGDALAVRTPIRRNIVWAEYDLRAGETFHEFDLILCRDVIRSLSEAERQRVYRLVAESLSRFGLLALAEDEKPDVEPYASWFRAWNRPAGVHQRVR